MLSIAATALSLRKKVCTCNTDDDDEDLPTLESSSTLSSPSSIRGKFRDDTSSSSTPRSEPGTASLVGYWSTAPQTIVIEDLDWPERPQEHPPPTFHKSTLAPLATATLLCYQIPPTNCAGPEAPRSKPPEVTSKKKCTEFTSRAIAPPAIGYAYGYRVVPQPEIHGTREWRIDYIEKHQLGEQWRNYLKPKPFASKRGMNPANHASPTLRYFLREIGLRI